MWLAKAANLQRSFANVPKQALVPTSVPKGICHYCHAGQTNYDFEDLGFNPAWKRTMFLPGDQPWKSRPALLDLPHDPSKPAAFFSFDIWHAFHLGLGKVFVASALACISDLFRGTNIDARFLELTDLYLQWCDENRTPAYIIGITKETCGWFDRKTYPNGQWHKGHITTTLLRFLSIVASTECMPVTCGLNEIWPEALEVMAWNFYVSFKGWRTNHSIRGKLSSRTSPRRTSFTTRCWSVVTLFAQHCLLWHLASRSTRISSERRAAWRGAWHQHR